MLRIPVLSVSCHEAMTLVIKPCALIPDSVHMCCTLVPRMLCHLSHGTDCPKNVGRSCDSHRDLIACIIGYLNSDLTGTVLLHLLLSIRSSHTCVKSELRYPIIQVIRSQWESQDFPTLGNQYHVTDDTASPEQGYNLTDNTMCSS